MEWISINTIDPEMKKYHLLQDDGVQVVLKYNLLQQSIRMSWNGKKQVFFIESGNAWNNRMLVRNAYGIEVGSFLFNNRSRNGRILMEGTVWKIALSGSEASLYAPGKQQPVLVCRLPEGNQQQPVQVDNLERASLLLGLCCYIKEQDLSTPPLKKQD